MTPAAEQADLVAAFEAGRVEGVMLAAPRIDTHLSHVFLTDRRAYKLKRAVRLPFVDFSTPAQRHAACRSELEVNRRFAGAMYLGVRAVQALPDGRYRIGGAEGEIADWLVEMQRFDQAGQFDELARAGGLTPALIEETADMIAAAHRDCPSVTTTGHTADYRAILHELRETETHGAARLGLGAVDPGLYDALGTELARLDPLIEARRRAGKVRRTHGDLHLRNICLFDGRPTPFDALEFDEGLATTDVLYDLAFLLMDLTRFGHAQQANALMNRYWDMAGEPDAALALLPFFMALRALVRLAVDVEAGALETADIYRRLAASLSAHTQPVAVAIGGLSGCGKSTVARRLAPLLPGAAGARLLRSDVVRKRSRGVSPEQPLTGDAYAPGARAAVYAALIARAREAFKAGASVIMDATFQAAEAREAALSQPGLPTHGLWLEVPLETRLERIAGRAGDASDADAAVARGQREPDHFGPGWQRIDASGSPETVLERVCAALGV